MRRLILALSALAVSACHATDICWPSSIPLEERTPCPSTHPYRNPWHPGYCYDTPQPYTPVAP